MKSLKGFSLLKLSELTEEEIKYLLTLSHKLKEEKNKKIVRERFKGKSLAMIFEKTSTRTRCAFETAFAEEGGHPVFLSTNDIQLGAKETIEDTAKVLGRMFDAIMFRGFNQSSVEQLALHSGVPVFNGLTDQYHPTQILADLMTIEEIFGDFKNKKLVFVGDTKNNVSISLMIGCAKMGIHFVGLGPKKYFPEKEIIDIAKKFADKNCCSIEFSEDIDSSVKDANIIYTDVWASMGQEKLAKIKENELKKYQVNSTMMEKTGLIDTIFLHCLPAKKDSEVTTDVFESANSFVFQQAENRKWTIKAIMVASLL